MKAGLLLLAVPSGAVLAALLLAVLLLPRPVEAPVSTCPGFPERARMVQYDGPLSDLFENGTVAAKIRELPCRCADSEPRPSEEGWHQVYYDCEEGVRFGAGIPDNSTFSRLPVATFVGNASKIVGPVVGSGPWEAALAEQNGTRRGA